MNIQITKIKAAFSAFFENTKTSSDEIFFDAMRGLAAILVYLSHADANRFFWYEPIFPLKGFLGELGVNLFFILSGYLIWTSAEKNLNLPKGFIIYGINRATRILPLYFVNLAFCIFVLPHFQTGFVPSITLDNFIRHITFTQGLLPSVSRAFNPVLWTLTHEVIFYCIVPLIFLFNKRYIAVLMSAIAGLYVASHFPSLSIQPFLEKFPLFVFGIFLTRFSKHFSLSIALILLLLPQFLNISPNFEHYYIAMGVFVIFFNLKNIQDPIYKLIARVLAPFGVISYSLYIWHYVLIEISPVLFNRFAIFNESMFARGLAFAVYCTVICTISYLIVERPMMTRFRKYLIVNFARQKNVTDTALVNRA